MENEKTGSVTLVGAGCGSGLITVEGLLALKQADVVVYDDLIDDNLLTETKAGCEWIYVGKRLGRHSADQEEINALLVRKAGKGLRVVRLKGGDSFLFGRGGEEILYLQKNHILWDVIPGVTSAVAVPAHAGIPVTHRGMAQSVTIVTGHSASGKKENYRALAALEGTLVFLMGLGRIEEITQALMANGKAPDTPAALLCRGYAADEKRIDGTLADIAGKAKGAKTPAILVVGQVADFHLERTLQSELAGVSVTVTGTQSFVKKAGSRLKGLGANVDCIPCLRVVPDYERIPDAFDTFDWLVFTSANGVEVFFEYLSREKKDRRRLGDLKFACIGPGTAGALEEYGIYADLQPAGCTAGALGRELGFRVKPGEKVLILRAGNGSPYLTEELKDKDISFEDIAVYHTEAIEEGRRELRISTDYVVFGSRQGAEVFLRKAELSPGTTPVCIGPLTAKALLEWKKGGAGAEKCMDQERLLVAEEYTVEGIIREIIKDRKEDRNKNETIQKA